MKQPVAMWKVEVGLMFTPCGEMPLHGLALFVGLAAALLGLLLIPLDLLRR